MDKLEIDYKKKIRYHFPQENDVYVCLYPFYQAVFVDDYNWKDNLKQTYPLLITRTWEEVSKDIGFNKLSRLAFGVLELREPYTAELNDYCGQEKLCISHFMDDKIPASILIPIIKFLLNNSVKEIKTKEVNRYSDSENKILTIKGLDEFAIYNLISEYMYFQTENFELLIPDFDCPYVLLSGKSDKCSQLIRDCNLEVFKTDLTTKFDWWNQ